MSDDSHDLSDLVRRDLERIELPPVWLWTPVIRHRAPSLPGGQRALALAIGTIALILLVAFGLQLPRGERSSNVATAPGAVATASPVPTAPPAATPSPQPISIPPPPPSYAATVQNRLPARGRWALVLGQSRGYWGSSVVAVPVAGTGNVSQAPLDLLWFSLSGTLDWPAADNLLREQLSPDGRRLVLSLTVSGPRLALVVVDLVAGTITPLTTDPAFHDVSPAWSPAGDEIAFVRIGSKPGGDHPMRFQHPDAGLWIVRADGTGLRRVLDADQTSHKYIYGWNADGTAIAFSRPDGGPGIDLPYELLEVATGRITRLGTRFASITTTRGVGDWRSGSPAFVGAFIDERQQQQFIVTADDQLGNGARDVIVDAPNPSGDSPLYFARWRPGSSDLLFVRRSAPNPPGPATLLVWDAAARAEREVKTVENARILAEWEPNGREIVYAEVGRISATVNVIGADGTNHRVLASFGVPGSQIDWIDFTVVGF